MIAAARLDAATYDEVAPERNATPWAAIIVAGVVQIILLVIIAVILGLAAESLIGCVVTTHLLS
jgi:hypothetical protein